MFFILTFMLQSALKDMEQRCPQLNKQITAAENLKNKTNNPQMRATLTDQSKHNFYFATILCPKSMSKTCL